jgi:hypothetical protein
MEWISVDDRLPELTETVNVGHYEGEKYIIDHKFPRSKDVIVAEAKGDGFEEDIGYLMRSGWATNCDNVTHWKERKEDE